MIKLRKINPIVIVTQIVTLFHLVLHKNQSPHKSRKRIKKLKVSQILRVNKVNHNLSHHKSSKRIKKLKVNQILRVSKVNHNPSHHK